ncbi:MAG: hypothetical protein ACOYMR_00150 [Ilumatobacteraceae bacterium]
MTFFSLSTWTLVVVLTLIIGGATALGVYLGQRVRSHPDGNAEPVGVVQAAMLGLVGLLLAFGLSMAVGRYETRRAIVVQESNDIGTTYLRAQLLSEPERTESMDLLRTYTDATIVMADQVPGTTAFRESVADVERLQNELWTIAGAAVAKDSVGTAPKLYIETLNDTIDIHTDRLASLNNRVPGSVEALQVIAAAFAAGALAMYLTVIGRSLVSLILVSAVLMVILFVSFDLDRPQRGVITVPFTALVDVRASMDGPPAVVP